MGVACAGGACRQPAPEPPGTGNRDPRRNLLRFLINLVRIQHILGPSYPGVSGGPDLQWTGGGREVDGSGPPCTAGRRMAVCVPNLLRNEGVPEWVSDSPGKPREAQGTQGGAQGGAWRPPL